MVKLHSSVHLRSFYASIARSEQDSRDFDSYSGWCLNLFGAAVGCLGCRVMVIHDVLFGICREVLCTLLIVMRFFQHMRFLCTYVCVCLL